MSAFNPHGNRTADGTVITQGMRVRTNDWTEGTVVTDDNAREILCCGDTTHADGQFRDTWSNAWFSQHGVTCEHGRYCGHDHWFTVETDTGGAKSYNGERLKALR